MSTGRGSSRRARAVLAVALATLGLAGCEVAQPEPEPSEECVSWIDFEQAQDVFDNAGAVVIAEPVATGRRESIFGVEVAVYELRVIGVLKGEVGDTVEVLSTPLTCRSDGLSYPGGQDPLAVEGELIVYLATTDEGTWRTLSPYDAAEPLPDDGTLPFLPGS